MTEKLQDAGYNCFVCGRRFAALQALRIHARIHENKKLYQCHDCGKTFKMEFYFKYHRLKDTGTEKFECGVCERKFSNENCVEAHYKVHSNDKSYVCRKCGKVYIQLGSFRNHVMAHPPMFGCKECKKIYTDSSSLAAHKRVHVTQKPFKCTNCGKRFAHAFNLEIHCQSYCTVQQEAREQESNTALSSLSNGISSVWDDRTSDDGTDPVKVEVIDLGSDSESGETSSHSETEEFEPLAIDPGGALPLEVCLKEGEEELQVCDLMARCEGPED